MTDDQTVRITVYRGVVTDVEGLPLGYGYIVDDLDVRD